MEVAETLSGIIVSGLAVVKFPARLYRPTEFLRGGIVKIIFGNNPVRIFCQVFYVSGHWLHFGCFIILWNDKCVFPVFRVFGTPLSNGSSVTFPISRIIHSYHFAVSFTAIFVEREIVADRLAFFIFKSVLDIPFFLDQ